MQSVLGERRDCIRRISLAIISSDSDRYMILFYLKQNHVAARVNRLLHDSLGSRGDFQNASILPFVSPCLCLQSLSFVILRWSPFASSPSLSAYSLLVPHSFSIPSFVRNLGKFSNSIPLLMIFDRQFLVTPFDPRPDQIMVNFEQPVFEMDKLKASL